MTDAVEVRRCFAAAAQGFAAVVSGIAADAWDGPGLGVWTVRDLVGHASRALSTIETYLAAASAGAGAIAISHPVDYLLAARSALVDPEAIARRGREAGTALGTDPVGAVAAIAGLAARVTALVAATPDDAPVKLPLGGTTLLTYLPTRTFELTVHSLDLVAALGGAVAVPAVMGAPVAACLRLAASVAARGPDGAVLLLALTGRNSLPPGFSVI